MPNLYTAFKDLLPKTPLMLGTVIYVGTGTAIVTLIGGAQLTVRGDAVINTKVWIKDGVIDSTAPSLNEEVIDI